MAIRHADPLELSLDVAARRPREQDVEIGNRLAEARHDGDEGVRPLHELRLETLVETDAVLQERAGDEGGVREAELAPRGRPRRLVDEGEVVEVDADRDPEDLLAGDAGRQHELLHLRVRDLHAVDARRVARQRLVRAVELRIALRAGPSRGSS